MPPCEDLTIFDTRLIFRMVEPAFRGAGQAEGMELWRIENLAPVKIPEVTGKFYTGDSYILLKTYRKGTSLAWNIHFWLGAESSQDETGVAAYKSVELDDSLGSFMMNALSLSVHTQIILALQKESD